MYGYQDSNEVAPGNSGGNFGLNSGVTVTKFEHNPNAGADGAEADALDLTVKVGEKEYRKRFFPVTKVYGKGDVGELTDTNSEEYKSAKNKAVSLLNATLSDIVKCFVSEEELQSALSAPINNFKDYALVLQRLVQSSPNWDKKPLDVFLSYQWVPKGDNKRTFLEIPKDVSQGTYLVPTEGEGFKLAPGDSIKYVNEEGVEHTFKRSSWYAGTPWAKQTVLEETPSSDMGAGDSTGASW